MKTIHGLTVTLLLSSIALSASAAFPTSPWCGLEGAPYHYTPPKAIKSSDKPSAQEIAWVQGLSAASDKKAFVDKNLDKISYQHMFEGLKQAAYQCLTRAKNENNIYQVLYKLTDEQAKKQSFVDKVYNDILKTSTLDCLGYTGAEDKLKKDAEKLKKDKADYDSHVFKDIKFVEGKKLKDRKEKLEKEQKKVQAMFQSCLNYAQVLNNTDKPKLYTKPSS